MSWVDLTSSKKVKEGKTKMATAGLGVYMATRINGEVIVTEGLCRHMRWPLGLGGKIKDDCIRCPLHQTTHSLPDGELKEWSPFPLFPAYGKLVGKFSRKKNLRIYETRVNAGNVEIKIES